MSVKLSSLAYGDTIEVRHTVKVDRVALGGRSILVRDRRGMSYGYDMDFARFDLIAKAPKPRPKVGDKIDGKTVRDTKWKRGTVIKAPVHIYVLTEDGDWYSPGVHNGRAIDLYDTRVTSNYLAMTPQGTEFEVVYLP